MITIRNEQTAAQAIINTLREDPSLTIVFDLDGVLLDASHRIKLYTQMDVYQEVIKRCGAPVTENDIGALDLNHYRDNSTPEQVAQDKPLPLIDVIHWLNANDRVYHVATARVACVNTKRLLRANQIKPQCLMARDGEHDHRRDHHLKTTKLQSRFSVAQLKKLVLLDDCLGNIKAARKLQMGAIKVDYIAPTKDNAAQRLSDALNKLISC
jgi:beta-phosphoglucomutase-like phosphatase (HAD superfamily)